LSEDTKRPREFQPIEDYKEILAYLTEGTKALASSMIWTEDQAFVINSHITSLDQLDKAFFVRIPKDFDLKQMNHAVASTGKNECFFSISLPSANLFFKTAFRDQALKELKFTIPKIAYKVQRRANVRFSIPEGHLLWVEFQDPLFPEKTLKKKVIDISAGGLAFSISQEEHGMYVPGFILRNMKFTVRGKLIVTEAEVRHKQDIDVTSLDRHKKVGILFKNLPAASTSLVATYVFDESRKYFMRFM
jgi:hypothetical protein